ncbi:hypothetical protein BD309DRAFT_1024389, partial [Dichomitus squalens]
MASGSRYAPLAEDDFESDDPGLHTHPAPSQAHTRLASPTATLQALGIINQAYVDWTISVTRDITRREVVNVYNVLGGKLYEHRNDFLNECDTTHATFKELDTSMTGLHTKADTARNLALKAVEENKQLKAELVTVNADLEVLNRNNTELVKQYKELAAKFTQLEQGLSTRTTLSISTAPAPVVSQASRIKASEPPKYKGNKGSDITLEQWLQKMGLWFCVQNITTDDNKITLALMYLEGGAHDYVKDYVETASSGRTLGSWTDFVNRLKAGYRQLAPEKTAQTSLEEWCSKSHSTVIQFAENFRRYASKSGYADVELIQRIDNQVGKNSQILTVMTAMRQVNPVLILTKWEHYLHWVLKLEMETRGNQAKSSSQQHTTSRPPRDPNTIDVDAMCKPEKLLKEQLKCLDKKLCFRCSKHKFTTGQK